MSSSLSVVVTSSSLLPVLFATAGLQDEAARDAAEKHLHALQSNPASGYTTALLGVLNPLTAAELKATQSCPVDEFQQAQLLAAVLLKQYVEHHWTEDEESFEPPLAPPQEKAHIRAQLLPLLCVTSDAKIRKTLTLATALIAACDFPHDWQDLLPFLLTSITQPTQVIQNLFALLNPLSHLVAPDQMCTNAQLASLQTFLQIQDYLEDEQLVNQIIPALFPALLRILAQPNSTPQAKVQAMNVYKTCIVALLQGNADKKQLTKISTTIIAPTLNDFVQVFLNIIRRPVNEEEAEITATAASFDMYTYKLEVFRVLNALAECFPAVLKNAKVFDLTFTPSLLLLSSLFPLYEATIMNADEEEVQETDFDEEGVVCGLEVLISEVFNYFEHVADQTATTANSAFYAFTHSPQELASFISLLCHFSMLSTPQYVNAKEDVSKFLSVHDGSSSRSGINGDEGEDDYDFERAARGFASSDNDSTGYMLRSVVRSLISFCMEKSPELVSKALATEIGKFVQISVQKLSEQQNGEPKDGKHAWWKHREAAHFMLSILANHMDSINVGINSIRRQEIEAQLAKKKKGKKKGASSSSSNVAASSNVDFDLVGYIEKLALVDLQQSSSPHVKATALSAVTSLIFYVLRLFNPQQPLARELQAMLNVMVTRVIESMAPVAGPHGSSVAVLGLRICALRHFGSLCVHLASANEIDEYGEDEDEPESPEAEAQTQLLKSIITPLLSQSLSSMCEVMSSYSRKAGASDGKSDELLSSAFSTLVFAVKVNPEVTLSGSNVLIPLILSCWGSSCSNDPEVTECILEIFEVFFQQKESVVLTQELITPTLKGLFDLALQQCASESSSYALSGAVDAALRLLESSARASEKFGAELQQAGKPVIFPGIYSDLAPTVLLLLLQTQDHSLLQSGPLTVSALVRLNPALFASLNVNNNSGLALLCQIVGKLLSNDAEDKAVYNVGKLITVMIFSLHAQLGQDNIQNLLKTVVVRLYSSVYPPLIESLLLVFARLIHASEAGPANFLNFLTSLGEIQVERKEVRREKEKPTDKYAKIVKTVVVRENVNALHFVLDKWLQAQEDIHGVYVTKVYLTALTKLLLTQDPRLQSIQTKGQLVQAPASSSSSSRPATRGTADASKAAQYTIITAPAKIISLVIRSWKEAVDAQEMKLKRQEKKAKQNENKDDDDEDDDDNLDDYEDDEDDDEFNDDDDDDDAFIRGIIQKAGKYKNQGPSFAPADEAGGLAKDAYIRLSDFADLNDVDEAEELESELYPEAKNDPLNEIQLQTFLPHLLHSVAASNPAALHAHASTLENKEKEWLNQLILAAAAQQVQSPQK